MVLGDFHIHTHFSDGKLSIAQVVDLYGRQGFDAIAITDHLCEEKTFWGKCAKGLNKTLTKETFSSYIDEILTQAERAKDIYGMTVIPGFEITKNSLSHRDSAHVLALGVQEYIDPDQDLFAVLSEIREKGGVSVAAHPVSTKKFEVQTYHLWDHRHDFAPYFDAWEVASGPYLFEQVKESGLPMIASSDLHHPLQMTSWKSIIQSENEEEALLEGIRKQRIEFRFWKSSAKDFAWNQ